MFQSLSDKLEAAFKSMRGQARISELNISNTVKEIRRALIDADVNYKIAKEFTEKVKEKAIGQKVIQSVTPAQLMIKIVQDELTELMGGVAANFDVAGNPAIILIAGLQGSGKTTFSSKLANYLKNKKAKNPLLVAADVYRPAAIDQLEALANAIEVAIYTDRENKNVVAIAQNAIKEAKAKNKNVVIIDTAGRLSIDEAMMNEIAALQAAVKPIETLFVVDATTGQEAVTTAKDFNDRLNFTGVVLTKLDGDARGGAALSVKYVVNKPIKFISRGEKVDTLDVFHPDRMAQRILGMGDIATLVEKATIEYDEEKNKKLEKKIYKNEFDLQDFLEQLQQIKKMGSFKDVVSMVPGMGKMTGAMDEKENDMKRMEVIIQSMTPKERIQPAILDQRRRLRVAHGSGRSIADVNAVLKNFEQMKKAMQQMKKMSTMRMGALGKKTTG